MIMAKLTEIEGIGDTYAAKLAAQGIDSQADLLDRCCTRGGRERVSQDCDISPTLILKWTNRADLARIKGVGEEYADLLECAGVDTVPELAQRNPENLHAKMEEVNQEKNLVRAMPSAGQVAGWVDEANQLDRVIEY